MISNLIRILPLSSGENSRNFHEVEFTKNDLFLGKRKVSWVIAQSQFGTRLERDFDQFRFYLY